MMTSSRKFEIWTSREKRFAEHSGDTYTIYNKLAEVFDISISITTLYRMKPGSIRNLTKGHAVLKVHVKCMK